MLADALLHLTEFILHIAHLVGAVTHLHRLIQLAIGHTAGSICQLMQRLQLEMADEETEQGNQEQADETDNERQSQE